MADYFPLIQRAVAALDPNTRERREAIYARAREALNRQLLALDPPIAVADLQRERNVLDETIRRVEAAFTPPAPVPERPEVVMTAPMPPASQPAVQPAPPPPEPTQARVPPEPPALPEAPALARPKVERRTTQAFGKHRHLARIMVFGLPVLVVFGIMAYLLRDDPSRYQKREPTAGAETVAGQQARKSEGRLDGTGGAPSAPAVSRPQPPQASTAPALPVAARALLFEETVADPRGVQRDGQVVWLSEPVPAGRGNPGDRMVRGTVSVSGGNMSLEVTFRRNRQTGLSASHIVEVTFRPEGEREGVKAIGPIEARDTETLPGIALKGAMVPIGTNIFLIGLDSNETAMAKNLEALRDQKWLAFQFQLTNDKLGAVLIEKGPTGDRVFREAMDTWAK
jgi:hypothetical protein